MNLPQKMEITATDVQCAEAIDGELVQVSFHSVKDDGQWSIDDDVEPYLLLSRSFMFDNDTSTYAEWAYEKKTDASRDVKSILLKREQLDLQLESNCQLTVYFQLTEQKFDELCEHLQRICIRSVQLKIER